MGAENLETRGLQLLSLSKQVQRQINVHSMPGDSCILPQCKTCILSLTLHCVRHLSQDNGLACWCTLVSDLVYRAYDPLRIFLPPKGDRYSRIKSWWVSPRKQCEYKCGCNDSSTDSLWGRIPSNNRFSMWADTFLVSQGQHCLEKALTPFE